MAGFEVFPNLSNLCSYHDSSNRNLILLIDYDSVQRVPLFILLGGYLAGGQLSDPRDHLIAPGGIITTRGSLVFDL